MKFFGRLTRSRHAPHASTSVDPTEGEATSLLTQTAGAVFGLLPPLMAARAANATPTQHGTRDGDADGGDHASAPAGSSLAHGGTGGMGQAASHDVPAAAVAHDGHGTQGGASHAIADAPPDAPGSAMQVDPSAAHSSGAPHPLVLPDAAPGGPEPASLLGDAVSASQDPTSASHVQDAMSSMAASVGDVSHGLSDASASSGDAVHEAASVVQSDLAQAVSHAGDGVSVASTDISNDLHGVAASLGDVAHAATSAVQSDLSQAITHVGDTVSAASTSLNGVLAPLGDAAHATSSLGLVHQATATVAGIADAGLHIGSLDVGAPASAGATSSAPLVQDASAVLTDATHVVTDVAAPLAAPTPEAPAATPPAAEPAPSVAATVTQSVSDIGHAAALTSDGSPLHIPLIGQSYMDDGAAHDAGFSLHALHGI